MENVKIAIIRWPEIALLSCGSNTQGSIISSLFFLLYLKDLLGLWMTLKFSLRVISALTSAGSPVSSVTRITRTSKAPRGIFTGSVFMARIAFAFVNV